MNLSHHPTEIALALLHRSVCHVQVAACIVDSYGVFAWSTNHMGFDGLGQHAEAEVVRKANKRRLAGAKMYVVAARRKNGKVVTAKPCFRCQRLIEKYGIDVTYRNAYGRWVW